MLTALYPWQTSLWQQHCQHLRSNRLAHALLVSGVKGLAKNSFSDHIVSSVLCLDRREDQVACGHCRSCRLFSAGSHPDHLVIQPEDIGKQIKIEQVRYLREKQQLTASVSKWKTIVISPADNMNVSSSNSLLKLLEEPQHNTLLILITSRPERLPITVRSRCQNYHLATPTTEQALLWLASNADYSGDSLKLAKLLQLAKGAPIAVANMLNEGILEQYQQVEKDFKLILQGRANPIVLAASWLKYDLAMVLNQLQYLIRDYMANLASNSLQMTANNAQSSVYWEISDCILHTIKLLSSLNNINNTLLIEDFIVSVICIVNSKMTNQ